MRWKVEHLIHPSGTFSSKEKEIGFYSFLDRGAVFGWNAGIMK
jgi:hypothetical protein